MTFDPRAKNPRRIVLLLVFFSGCLGLGRLIGGQPASSVLRNGGGVAGSADEKRLAPIVVELFTSQGCSSCPAADEFLRLLGNRSQAGEPEVLPLAFHVDYWNYIGWQDPFSSDRWSDRQRQYARQLSPSRVYTPQLVIDGREHRVGSDRKAIWRSLQAAKTRTFAYEVDLVAALASPRRLELGVVVRGREPGKGPLDLWVAVHESGLLTEVERGENARRTLRNDYVVRYLEKIGSWAGGLPHDVTERRALELGWAGDAEKMGVVAFLQDPRTLFIYGAAGVSGLGLLPGAGKVSSLARE